MDADDDLTTRIIEGDPYAQASVAERRMIPIGLRGKIIFACVVLAVSGLLTPAIAIRTDLITQVEPATSENPYRLSIGTFTLLGVATNFVVALFLLYLRYTIIHEVDSVSAARKIIRIEDIAAWFLVFGTAAVAISLSFATIGIVSPETIVNLTESGVRPYRPESNFVGDVRIASVGGLIASGLVFALYTLLERS